jgi:hypothetical protein
MMQHPGKTFSIFNVTGCVNAAHQKTVTPASIVAAFRTTATFPYDKTRFFIAAEFLSSFVTDRPSEML